MCDGDHRLSTLAQGKSRELRNAVFRGDVLDHRARRGLRRPAGDERQDVALALAVLCHARRVDADEALAALGAERTLEEVHLSADAGKLTGAGGLGIFLPHEVKLHAAVDADNVFHRADAGWIMDVVKIAGVEQVRIFAQPVVQLVRTHRKVPCGATRVELLACVRELACLIEREECVADRARVTAEVF